MDPDHSHSCLIKNHYFVFVLSCIAFMGQTRAGSQPGRVPAAGQVPAGANGQNTFDTHANQVDLVTDHRTEDRVFYFTAH